MDKQTLNQNTINTIGAGAHSIVIAFQPETRILAYEVLYAQIKNYLPVTLHFIDRSRTKKAIIGEYRRNALCTIYLKPVPKTHVLDTGKTAEVIYQGPRQKFDDLGLSRLHHIKNKKSADVFHIIMDIYAENILKHLQEIVTRICIFQHIQTPYSPNDAGTDLSIVPTKNIHIKNIGEAMTKKETIALPWQY